MQYNITDGKFIKLERDTFEYISTFMPKQEIDTLRGKIILTVALNIILRFQLLPFHHYLQQIKLVISTNYSTYVLSLWSSFYDSLGVTSDLVSLETSIIRQTRDNRTSESNLI